MTDRVPNNPTDRPPDNLIDPDQLAREIRKENVRNATNPILSTPANNVTLREEKPNHNMVGSAQETKAGGPETSSWARKTVLSSGNLPRSVKPPKG